MGDDLARAGLYGGPEMAKRAYHELVGLYRGILGDGHVGDEEVVALEQWCQANPRVVDTKIRVTLTDSTRLELEDVSLVGDSIVGRTTGLYGPMPSVSQSK